MQLFEILASVSKGRVIPTSTSMRAWGQNDYGALGLNTTTLVSSPTQIGSTSNWSKVSIGRIYNGTIYPRMGASVAAINSTGALYVWGQSYDGVSDGYYGTANRSSPVQVSGSWSSAASNQYITYGIKSDGTLWAWGRNVGLSSGRPAGTVVFGDPPSWSMLDSTGFTVLGIKNDTLYMWGSPNGAYWPTNDFSTSYFYSPNTVFRSSTGSNYISGYGYITAVSKAQFVPSGGTGYTALALARISPDGVAAGNTYLIGWGKNDRGLLRSTSQYNQVYPVAAVQWDQPITNFWATPANGVRYNTGVADGAVFMRTANGSGVWGYGHGYAALGINSQPSYNQSSPVVIMATNTYPNVVSMALGTGQTLALTDTNALYAWGHPTYSGLSGYNVTVTSTGTQANLQLSTDKSQPWYPDPVVMYRDGPTGQWQSVYLQFANTSGGALPHYDSAVTLIGSGASTFDTYQANTIVYDLYSTPGSKQEISIVNNSSGWTSTSSNATLQMSGSSSTIQKAGGEALAAFINKLTNQTASMTSKSYIVYLEKDDGFSAYNQASVTATGAYTLFGGYQTVISGTVGSPPSYPSMGMSYATFFTAFTSNDYYFKSYYILDNGPSAINYSPYEMTLRFIGPYAVSDSTDFVAAMNGTYTYQGNVITGGFVPSSIVFQTMYDGYFEITNITSVTNPFAGQPYVTFTGTVTQTGSGYTGLSRATLRFYFTSPSVTSYVPTDLGRISLKFNTTAGAALTQNYNNGGVNTAYMYWATGTWSNTTSTLTTTGQDKLLIPPPQTPSGNTLLSANTPKLVEWARWGNGTPFSVGSDFKSIAAGNGFSLAVVSKGGANLVVSFGNNTSGVLGRTFADANTAIPTVISYTNGVYSNTGANWKWVAASPYTGYMVNGDDYAIGSNTPFPNNAVFFTGNNSYYQAGGYIAYSANMQPTSWVSAGTYYPLSQNTFGIQGITHTIVANTSGQAISSGYGESGQFGNGMPASPGTLYTGVSIPGGEQTELSSPVQVGLPRKQNATTGENSWTMVVPFDEGAVALHKDKTLYAWGLNTPLTRDAYTNTGGFSPYQISASSYTFITVSDDLRNIGFAIKTDGTLWRWGFADNSYSGENSLWNGLTGAGLPNYYESVMPFNQVWTTDVASWTAVTTTGNRTWAISATDGSLWGWGHNYHNSSANSWPLGANLTLNYDKSWTYLTTGSDLGQIAAAIGTEGQLYLWGRDYSAYGGLLGMQKPWPVNTTPDWGSSTSNDRYTAKQMWSDKGSWTQVAVGYETVAAINADGNLYFVGKNQNGEFGSGSPSGSSVYNGSPVSLAAAAGKSWTGVDTGTNTLFATQSDGSLWAWGYLSGYSAANTLLLNVYRSSPVQVLASGVSKLVVGNGGYSGNPLVTVIKTDGTLWGWNRNTGGILNALGTYPTTTVMSSPVQMAAGSWTSVATTGDIIAAIRSDGTLWGWGATFITGTNSLNYMIPGAPKVGVKNWSQIDMSPGGTAVNQLGAGIDTTGGLWIWGNGFYGELGDSTTGTAYSPVKVGNSSWSQVAVGGSHIAAIDSTGRLFTWGSNFYGQGGRNTFYNTYISSPVQVGTGTWSKVAVNQNMTAAITSAGQLFTWGYSGTYQTGHGNTTNKSSPVQVAVGTSFTQISVGSSFCAAISTDGGLWTWGAPQGGQLGNGSTTTYKTTPARVGTSSWTSIAAGNGMCHAIRLGGALFGWGNNASGSVGNGTTTNVLSPVQIGTSSWSMVAGQWGLQNRYGMIGTSTVYAWGGSSLFHGQNGSQASRSSPVVVSTVAGTKQTVPCGLATVLLANGWAQTWGSPHSVVGSGNNTYGVYFIFGNTSQPFVSSPVQLDSGSYTQVALTANSVMGIKTDGSLWSWGFNAGYPTGNTTATYLEFPTQYGTSSWSMLGTKMRYGTIAVTTTGDKWVFGGEMVYALKEPAGTDANSGYRAMSVFLNQGTIGNIAPFKLEPTARVGIVTEPTLIDSSSWTMLTSGAVGSSNVQNGNTSANLLNDAVVLGVKDDYSLWMWGSVNYPQSNGWYNDNSNATFMSTPTLVGTNTQITIGVATRGGATIVLKNG